MKKLFPFLNITSLKRWTILLIALVYQTAYAQELSTNELKAKVNDSQKTKAQLDILNQLVKRLIEDSNTAEAQKYGEKAEKLAKAIGNEEGLADTYTQLGNLQVILLGRPDKAYEYHEKAYRIYTKLFEAQKLDQWKLHQFLTKNAIPTYQYAVDSDSKKRRYRKAIQNYEKLNAEFTTYLASLVSETKQELSEKENKLLNTTSQLREKEFAERNLILDKLKLSGTIEKKELEALALSDSLMRQDIELKNQALRNLEEKAKREKAEQEKTLQETELQKERLWNSSLLGMILLGSLLLLTVVIVLINQRRVNKILTRQRNELALKNQEIQQQKEEIEAQRDNIEQQNAELQQQKEEIEAQRDNIEQQNAELQQQKEEIETQRDMLAEMNEDIINQRDKSDELLLNILPDEVAEELKETGKAKPRYYEMVTVLFTDFKGFTKIASMLTPEQIIQELEYCFTAFDEIIAKYDMEKIKTIGDAYMAAGGLPVPNTTNPIDAVKAALAMQDFMQKFKLEKLTRNEPVWELRVGIHTGPLVAGVIGKNKFAYDIWGDTVNLASRMESTSEAGKVNISGSTFEFVKAHFNCSYRGKIYAKNKGDIDMYFVDTKKTSLFQSIQSLKI